MKGLSYITGTERAALIVAAIAVAVAVFMVVRNGGNGDSGTVAVQDSVRQESGRQFYDKKNRNYDYHYDEGQPQAELFPFDPNTADSTQLLRLGLRPWQVRSIYRYRAKGGMFRTKEDFARVYGLTKLQYERLQPYIQISDDYRPAAEVYGRGERPAAVRDTVRYPLKLRQGEHIALNTADTTLLKRVPGVGSYFAKSIVYYREKLGGFYSVNQLKEIEGFPLEALSYFTLGNAQTRRININEARLGELRRHPYIGYYMAKTIVDHRRLHGEIHSFDDLRLYRDFTPEAIERLRNYVIFK